MTLCKMARTGLGTQSCPRPGDQDAHMNGQNFTCKHPITYALLLDRKPCTHSCPWLEDQAGHTSSFKLVGKHSHSLSEVAWLGVGKDHIILRSSFEGPFAPLWFRETCADVSRNRHIYHARKHKRLKLTIDTCRPIVSRETSHNGCAVYSAEIYCNWIHPTGNEDEEHGSQHSIAHENSHREPQGWPERVTERVRHEYGIGLNDTSRSKTPIRALNHAVAQRVGTRVSELGDTGPSGSHRRGEKVCFLV